MSRRTATKKLDERLATIVTAHPFDVAVVGAGPAGSVAALVLARGGARVALVDRAGFPRDKACGDLIGPRGVQVLLDLDLDVTGVPRLGDMAVIGPTGSRVVLPARPGRDYPGYALAVARTRFDAMLRDAALDAGASPVAARVVGCDPAAPSVRLDDGSELRAGVVIGADGALSTVADGAALCDASRSLWGFALRFYADDDVDLPTIVFWDESSGRGLPGYGWVFPGESGGVNVGLGVGTGAQRRLGTGVTRHLPAFLEHLHRIGATTRTLTPSRSLGGWLRVGGVGTVPARGRVLLVGDAAGLVNPLQGEGIAHALTSGRAAARAVLREPASAACSYRTFLARDFGAYASTTATVHAAMVQHPRLVSSVGRTLTNPVVGPRIAGAWGVYWNALLRGSSPSVASAGAAVASGLGRVITATARTRREIHRNLHDTR